MRVGARRSSPRVLFSGNANPGGCNEGELERTAAGDVALPPAPDALRPGSGSGHGTPVWGLEQDAVRPGCIQQASCYLGEWELGNKRGKRRGTQSGQWLRRRPPDRGKLRGNDERPVCRCSETGACQSSGAAVCVQQLRRNHGEAAGACCPLQPQSVESAKQVNRSADYAEGVRDTGETVLGLADTSCQWDFREFRVRRGKGIWDAVICPVATSEFQSVGSGFRVLEPVSELLKQA